MAKPVSVIVTGGGTGIGLGVAAALLDGGHQVHIAGRNADRLSEAQKLLALRFGNAAAKRLSAGVCDVRDFDACKTMAAAACYAFGRIDALVNNAGISFIKSIDDISDRDWRDIIDTNLTGAFHCTKAVLPYLREAGGGDIVNLGSRSGRYSFKGGVGYNTTKFGLQGFTEALFLDLHRDNIRVSLVAPGTVATGLAGAEKKAWFMQPEDVGKVVVDILAADRRACVNWVELRPADPQ